MYLTILFAKIVLLTFPKFKKSPDLPIKIPLLYFELKILSSAVGKFKTR